MDEMKLKVTKGCSTVDIILDISTLYLTYTVISRNLIWIFNKRESPLFAPQSQVYGGLSIQYSYTGHLQVMSTANICWVLAGHTLKI